MRQGSCVRRRTLRTPKRPPAYVAVRIRSRHNASRRGAFLAKAARHGHATPTHSVHSRQRFRAHALPVARVLRALPRSALRAFSIPPSRLLQARFSAEKDPALPLSDLRADVLAADVLDHLLRQAAQAASFDCEPAPGVVMPPTDRAHAGLCARHRRPRAGQDRAALHAATDARTSGAPGRTGAPGD